MAVSEYSVVKIELIAFHLSPDTQKLDLSNTAITYNVTVSNQVSDTLEEDNEFLNSVVTISIGHKEDLHLVIFEVAVIYSIVGLCQVVGFTDNKKVTVPKDILDNVSNVSISMARGMLFFQLKGTKLHNAIIPLVELNKDPNVQVIED
ncbi:hypothetical protein [Dyadobacter sp. CY312]|uniref:hypothetical protein n=1 Tax=Dyadobacter sp. CY312 TaxID=2907303 RepID=UPI001F4264BC|nr:hypothetical protein [Dyadobacter sp. CY312]MCE7044547.1 hypothetical protein [Dyadobacter sp. CY312]